MTYLQQFQSGNLVLPSALLFHFEELFSSADDFLVWQFFFFQNTSKIEALAPSQIAQATGKSVGEVNQAIENLQKIGALSYKTINLAGEIEMIFDAFPVFEKLDALVTNEGKPQAQSTGNAMKELVEDFERELGRLLSPFELEDLQKTLQEEEGSLDLIRLALRQAVFNNKTNWSYIQAILRNWRREGITTVAQAEAKNAEREVKKPQNVVLTDDFLQAKNLWKD